MKTITAIYRGNRTIELAENLDLPQNAPVLVLIPGEADETEMRQQLQAGAARVFAKLWDNAEDEVWNEYLQTT